MTTRLFVGLEIPDDVRDHIYTLRGGLRSVRWVPKENYHLTLRFVGNVEDRDTWILHEALLGLKFKPFKLGLKTLGMFTVGDNPKHIWTGVSDYQTLDLLADKVDTVAKRLGFTLEQERNFHAHVTIGKCKGAAMDEMQAFIAYNNLFKTREFDVTNITLFSSHQSMKREGSEFSIEGRYPLKEE